MNELHYPAYELKVNSSTSQLAAIRSFIREHISSRNIDDKTVDSIVLAVDEAATNIVKHAYHMRTDQLIFIHLMITDCECVISLKDFGDAFDPSLVPEPDMEEYLRQKKVGGLGLFLIRTLMDDMEYQSIENEYNLLTLRKSINQ